MLYFSLIMGVSPATVIILKSRQPLKNTYFGFSSQGCYFGSAESFGYSAVLEEFYECGVFAIFLESVHDLGK